LKIINENKYSQLSAYCFTLLKYSIVCALIVLDCRLVHILTYVYAYIIDNLGMCSLFYTTQFLKNLA